MSQQLSKEDTRRVNNCEYYRQTKQIMENHEAYKNFEVGEVYYIKRKLRDGRMEYVTTGYGSDTRLKFMVFHKDNGFIFVKRIIASGKLGKEVTCLTTSYGTNDYILEPDPEYVNSMLLGDEEGYDPLATAKELTSKKNRARRRNKKLELCFNEAADAYNYIKKLKKGDRLFSASTAYGSDITEWVVDKVSIRGVDQNAIRQNGMGWGSYHYSNIDTRHHDNGFTHVISVKIKMIGNPPKNRSWMSIEENIHFTTLQDKHWQTYYETRPFTVDDV